jgi:hypothetical protein
MFILERGIVIIPFNVRGHPRGVFYLVCDVTVDCEET